MSPRLTFEIELKNLQQAILEMSEQVEHAYVQLIKGLEDKNEHLLKQVMEGDHTVNDMQRAIEAKCLTLITKQTPVARDLRLISAALKVVTDIERIGDHAADIAELLLHMHMPDLNGYSVHFEKMLTSAMTMIKDSADAFVQVDVAASRKLNAMEEVVDECFCKIREDIIMQLKGEEKDVDCLVDALMIAKYLERVGDHAVNVCEWEVFQETGIIEDYRIL